MEPTRLALYYKSPNSPRPMLYWSMFINQDIVLNLTLTSDAATAEGFLYYFEFIYFTRNSTLAMDLDMTYAHTRYNNTLSYLRLGVDGNLKFHTYSRNVQVYAWEVAYAFFDRDSLESECQLPERCGKFGLCQNSQCVACPTPNGLIGWSEDCESKLVTSCKASDFGYYKLEGVNHFMIRFTRGDGGTKQSDCESKCTKDCKCMGYFYHTADSRCWIAYDLKTLRSVRNSTHLAYIKTPKM